MFNLAQQSKYYYKNSDLIDSNFVLFNARSSENTK